MPSNVKLLAGASGGEPTDANFKNVTLLLHGDGSNGAQNNTFIDSSTNNFTITRNGNTTQGSFSPYGSNWSNYFDGSGDYLSLADNAALQMGSGDFTIEFWWNPSSISGYQTPYEKGYTGSGGLLLQTGAGDGKIVVYASGSAVITASTAVTVGVWNHMALVRNGTSLVLYLNGVSVGSATNSTNFNSTGSAGIGANVSGGGAGTYPITGYLSNVRVVKGTAVYTSAFTPPTAPLTAITNTSLLTCADNRFRDGSTNNFTITRNGDVKVTNFAPFAPSSAYSTTTNGGSAYFDGSGDYLTAAANTAFAFGTGDFTVEFWFNAATYRSSGGYFSCMLALGNFSDSPYFRINHDGRLTAGITATNEYYTTSTVNTNSWMHFAVTRQGSTVRLFVNGVLENTQTNSTNLANSTAVHIGTSAWQVVNETFTGYISNIRIIKGAAQYTASFTPPSSPVTAITNTSLLTNFTNAAIFDNSMKNDLETVGNAQISTSVKKFGTGSMYFDGSGDYLAIPFSDQMKFGTGDFTIEFWIYPTADSGDWFPVSSIGNLGFFFGRRSSGGWGYGITGSAWEYSSGTNPTLNTWQHVAISRSGTSIRIFVNGTQVGTTQTSGSDYSLATGGTSIGSQGANYYVTGYMDEFRITKGVARYTANFTAPTAPFPNK